METLVETKKKSEIKKSKPILRRNKYYIKAKNEVCALCNNGFGCCKTSSAIYFKQDDFNIDFTNRADVEALLSTNLFTVRIGIDDWVQGNRLIIYIKKKTVGNRKNVCVFWDEHGCRLIHDSRPSICRYQTCHTMGESVKRNLIDAKTERKNEKITYEQMLTVLQTMHDIELDNNGYMSKKDVKSIDWKHVLSIL